MLVEYKFLLGYFLFCFFIGLLLVLVSYFLILTSWDYEKISIYECGFIPFEDSRGKFPVQFLLYAIIFLVFDLELSFFFPWTIMYLDSSFWGVFSIFIFIYILLLGFFYEWLHGIFELD